MPSPVANHTPLASANSASFPTTLFALVRLDMYTLYVYSQVPCSGDTNLSIQAVAMVLLPT